MLFDHLVGNLVAPYCIDTGIPSNRDAEGENEGYCAKWQMGLGTKMHDQCISDLQELRSKIQDRLADQLDF